MGASWDYADGEFNWSGWVLIQRELDYYESPYRGIKRVVMIVSTEPPPDDQDINN
jgi:hypothetical protein